jgi:hypothetical protein
MPIPEVLPFVKNFLKVFVLGCLLPTGFPLEFHNCIKSFPLQLDFHLEEEEEIGLIH